MPRVTQGGDKRSGCIEAFADVILDYVSATPDITPVEIVERLRAEHGQRFAAD